MTRFNIQNHQQTTAEKMGYSPAINLKQCLNHYLLFVSTGEIDTREFDNAGNKTTKERVKCSHVIVFDRECNPILRHDGSKFYHKFLFPKLLEPGLHAGELILHPVNTKAYDLDAVPDEIRDKMMEFCCEHMSEDDFSIRWEPGDQERGYNPDPF